MIEIIDKGFWTIPVSGTRHGMERFGVPRGGPMDLCRCVLANRLAGNSDDAWALEAVMVFPSVRFLDDRAFAVVSGDCELQLKRGGQTLTIPLGEMIWARAGDELRGSPLKNGFRGYLAVSGGLAVSTARPQPLRPGACLPLGSSEPPAFRRLIRDPSPLPGGEPELRVLEGVHAERFSPEGLATFYHSPYVCTSQSDRMGLRLSGAPIAFCPGADGNILSEGMMPGDIQVASDGQPILMMADCQTVGGYAKIAHVIGADLPTAAQLRPGTKVRFREVIMPEAQAAWRKLWRQMELCLC